MKKLLSLSIYLSIFLLGCKEEPKGSIPNPSGLDSKSSHAQNSRFRKVSDSVLLTKFKEHIKEKSPVRNTQARDKFEIEWDELQEFENNSNNKKYFAPIHFTEREKVSTSVDLLQFLVFNTENELIISTEVVEIGRIENSSVDDETLIMNYKESRFIEGFSGFLLIKDLNSPHLQGKRFEKGNYVGKVSKGLKKSISDRSKLKVTQVIQCFDVYWVTYYSDGTEDWTYIDSYCIVTGGGDEGSGNPPSGGSGSGSGQDQCEAGEATLIGAIPSNMINSAVTTAESGGVRQKMYEWTAVDGVTWSVRSVEIATLEPSGVPAFPWKFKTFGHDRVYRAGIAIGGNVTILGATAIIQKYDYNVMVGLNSTLEMQLICKNPLIPSWTQSFYSEVNILADLN